MSKAALVGVSETAWKWQVQQQQQAAHPQACQMRNEHEEVLAVPKAGGQWTPQELRLQILAQHAAKGRVAKLVVWWN